MEAKRIKTINFQGTIQHCFTDYLLNVGQQHHFVEIEI